MDKFIEKYVCCPKCKLPEMYLTVNGDKINGKCDSCPFVGELDNKHRLASFIIKNPPIYKSQATKVAKIEAERISTNTTNTEKKEIKKEESVEDVAVVFNPDIMDFGSEEL
jgi:translation initiation factor 5